MHLNKVYLDRLAYVMLIGFMLLLAPITKNFWYDEQISILISNGFDYHNSQNQNFTDTNLATVLSATKSDNGNGLMYNVVLYYWQQAFATTPFNLALLSVLLAGLSLLVFYEITFYFFTTYYWRLVCCILLLTDLTFIGMATEIRSYMLACLMCLMVVYLALKIVNQPNVKVRLILLFTLFSILAFFSHFLTLYVIIPVWFFVVLEQYRDKSGSKHYTILGLILLVTTIVTFGVYALDGMKTMQQQNSEIAERIQRDFSISAAIMKAARIFNINSGIPFSRFHSKAWLHLIEFTVLLSAFIYFTVKAVRRHNLQEVMLVALALSGIGALLTMAIFAGHESSLYFRYFLFSIPFEVILVVYIVNYMELRRNLVWLTSAILIFTRICII